MKTCDIPAVSGSWPPSPQFVHVAALRAGRAGVAGPPQLFAAAGGIDLESGGLGRAVLQKCESWEGFDTLRRVLLAYPDIECYVAGGIVRDLISGHNAPAKDFDFFLCGKRMAAVLADLAIDGRMDHGPFGSPRWLPGPGSAPYADLMPIEQFRNGLWGCEDIVDALNQFDFTANAVAVDLRRLEVFNPQNGVRDARGRVMRAVRFDYPDEPIAPGSALSRWLVLWCRLLHYAAALGYWIEPVTLAWLRANARFCSRAGDFEKAFFPLHAAAFDPLSEAPK
jgi:hypothetical protein